MKKIITLSCLFALGFSGADAWAGNFPWKVGTIVKDEGRKGVIVRSGLIDPFPPPSWVLDGKSSMDFFTGPVYLPGPPADPEARARYLMTLEWRACGKTLAEVPDGIVENVQFRYYIEAVRIVASGHPGELGKTLVRSFCCVKTPTQN